MEIAFSFYEALRDIALQPRQTHIEASLWGVTFVEAQVHFAIYRRVSRHLDLYFAGDKPNRADESHGLFPWSKFAL
jgi:hypothetical protein